MCVGQAAGDESPSAGDSTTTTLDNGEGDFPSEAQFERESQFDDFQEPSEQLLPSLLPIDL